MFLTFMHTRKKYWLFLGLLIIALGAGVFWWYDRSPSYNSNDPYAGWKEYQNESLGYAMKYPGTWEVDKSRAASSASKEVNIYPPDAEPFMTYMGISLEQRSIYDVQNNYNQNIAAAELSANLFNGQTALLYRFPGSSRQEIYIPYGERTYHIITDRMDILDVKQMLKSFVLLEPEAKK